MAQKIPVGAESFDKIRTHGLLYVDKTELLVPLCQDVIDGKMNVHVFTRPTRFGKTLNLSMIERFFDVAYDGAPDVFENLDISRHQGLDQLKNRYPVIRINFRDIDPSSPDQTKSSIRSTIMNVSQDIISRYGYGWMSDNVKGLMDSLANGKEDYPVCISAIRMISRYLRNGLRWPDGSLVGNAPVILIDEYDAFLHDLDKAPQDRVDEVTRILSKFMTSILKTNEDFSLGVVTGVLRLSQTGILSGLNSPVMHDMFDEGTGRFFGYTEEEVRKLVNEHVPEPLREKAMADARHMYDGYVFGKTEVYNPRSINMYLADGDFYSNPKEYWEQSRRNYFLDSLVESSPQSVQDMIAGLAVREGSEAVADVAPATVYQDVYRDPSSETALVSCLVVSGYLKAVPLERIGTSLVRCSVSVPSREMAHAYSHLVATARARRSNGNGFVDALYSCDGARATREFSSRLESHSIRDPWSHQRCKEHLLGYFLDRFFAARAEAETGNGFVDVLVERDPERGAPPLCIEITTTDEAGTMDLGRTLELCERKFEDRRYGSGFENAILVAFAWDRKACRIAVKRTSDEEWSE